MRAVFHFLYDCQVQPDDILDCLLEINFVDGIIDLLKQLHKAGGYEVIIISDSNSVFIEHIMQVISVSYRQHVNVESGRGGYDLHWNHTRKVSARADVRRRLNCRVHFVQHRFSKEFGVYPTQGFQTGFFTSSSSIGRRAQIGQRCCVSVRLRLDAGPSRRLTALVSNLSFADFR